MREIKFRAWDKLKKFMIKDFQTKNIFQTVLCRETVDGCFFGDYSVMQFTGLQDKNAVDIYEGDILSSKAVISWCGGTGADLGMEVGFHLQWRNFESHEPLEGVLYEQESCHRIYEVIGNIHENPELLEGE